MLDEVSTKQEFHIFKKQYAVVLESYILDETNSELFLHQGYLLGRKAVAGKINLLDVTSIHHSILVNCLESIITGNHIFIVEKASIFFEKVLAPFEMVSIEFREAIKLLNRSSVEFAVHIHNLKDEITNRKQIENDLQTSKEKYRLLSEELQSSLKEKEALLKEVYHRVKNNLQVVTSLINLQLDTLKEEESKRALIESGARVKSMALVHEMLYQSRNLAEITMDEYIAKLINYLYEIYNINPEKIKYTLKTESVLLNIDKAIPLGLIVSEIISNSLKHAFPGSQKGEVHISLNKNGNKTVVSIEDNGIGISDDYDHAQSNSLGMRLIYNLSKQINGTISLESNNGTRFIITIP